MTPEERFCEIAVAARFMTEGQAGKLLEDWVGASREGSAQKPLAELIRERGLMTTEELAQVQSLRDHNKTGDLDWKLLQVAVTRGLVTEAQAERAARQHESESRVQEKRLLSVLLEMHALTQAQAERLLSELAPGSPSLPPGASMPALAATLPTAALPPAETAVTMPLPQVRSNCSQTRRELPLTDTAPPRPPAPVGARKSPNAPPRDTRRSAHDVRWRMLALEMRSLVGAVMLVLVLAIVAGGILMHLKNEDSGEKSPLPRSRGTAADRPASAVRSPRSGEPWEPPEVRPSSEPKSASDAWDSSRLARQIVLAQEAESQGRYGEACTSYDAALKIETVAADSVLTAALTHEQTRTVDARLRLESAVIAEGAGSLGAARPMYVEALDTSGTLRLAMAAAAFLQVPAVELGRFQRRLLITRYNALVGRARAARAEMKLVYALTCYEMAERIVDASRCEPALPEPGLPKSAATELAGVLAGKLGAGPPPLAAAQTDPSPPAPGPIPPAPQPGKEPPPAPSSDKRTDDLSLVPGIEEVQGSDLQELCTASAVLFDLWRDRANLALSIDEKQRGVKEADERIGKLPKATTDKPAVLFVQGVTHFLLARGIFEEYLGKRSAASTREEKRQLVEQYEPLYNRELGTAANKLTLCRKAARKHYAAAVFEDLSRAWDLGAATATRGIADAKKDMDYLHPESSFDNELQVWIQQGALPPPR